MTPRSALISLPSPVGKAQTVHILTFQLAFLELDILQSLSRLHMSCLLML